MMPPQIRRRSDLEQFGSDVNGISGNGPLMDLEQYGGEPMPPEIASPEPEPQVMPPQITPPAGMRQQPSMPPRIGAVDREQTGPEQAPPTQVNFPPQVRPPQDNSQISDPNVRGAVDALTNVPPQYQPPKRPSGWRMALGALASMSPAATFAPLITYGPKGLQQREDADRYQHTTLPNLTTAAKLSQANRTQDQTDRYHQDTIEERRRADIDRDENKQTTIALGAQQSADKRGAYDLPQPADIPELGTTLPPELLIPKRDRIETIPALPGGMPKRVAIPGVNQPLDPVTKKILKDQGIEAPEGDLPPEVHKSYKSYAEKILTSQVKPDPAAKPKDTFMATMAKVAGEGGLGPNEMADVGKLTAAIKKSTIISPEERNSALAYLAANTTPASAQQSGVVRATIMAGAREYPVINKQSGELEMRNASEINASPGNFAPAGAEAGAMAKRAVFDDLHFNIDTARKAITGLASLDVKTRGQLAYALRDTDPKSAVQSFLTGAIGSKMTPEQREAVQSIQILHENAMSLRSVAGMGQGSDELRRAIWATLPSAKSVDKNYMLSQINKFEEVVKRLEGGVPGMKNRGGGSGGGGKITVVAPDGSKHDFATQAEADTFKKLAKIP